MTKVIILIFFIYQSVYAQTISGPTTVCIKDTFEATSYTLTVPNYYYIEGTEWYVWGGDIVSQTINTITVRWKTNNLAPSNTGFISANVSIENCETIYPDPVWYCQNETHWVCDWEWELQDWVNCRWETTEVCDWSYGPPYTVCDPIELTAELAVFSDTQKPATSFTVSYNCGVSYTITRSAIPPANETWYWQDTFDSFSTANSASTYTVTTSGTKYLRAKKGNCWSNPTAITITAYNLPGVATGNVNPNVLCSPGNVTWSASGVATSEEVYRWYSVSTGGSPVTPPTYINLTSTYFVSVYNTVTKCEGTRTPVTVTYNPATTAPTITGNARFGSGPLILIANGTPSGGTYKWYNSSNSYLPPNALTYTTPSLSTSISNYMFVRAVSSSGCEGPQTAINVTIYPQPVVSAPQTFVTKSVPVTLSTGVYDSYQWKNSSNVVVSSSPTFTTNQIGNYTVTVTKAGVTGTGLSTQFVLGSQYSSMDMNYIITDEVSVSNVVDVSQVATLPIEKASQQITYFDGLGRPMQTVETQSSPGKNDIVVPVVYDPYGREVRKYLPVVTENNGRYKPAILDGSGNYTVNTYNNTSDKIADDTRPFSETLFEASPLNRPDKEYGPGLSWSPAVGGANKFIQHAYLINVHNTGNSATQEKVIAWTVSAGNLPVRATTVAGYIEAGGYYASGQLQIKSTKDEEGNEVREYTDKLGRVILKKVQAAASTDLNNLTQWALTYYVYDDLGNLRLVLPPELSKLIHTNADTYLVTPTDLTNWAFQYKYDGRKRMIEKQVPGAGAVYMVYDNRDRLVLTQDGKQRGALQWTFSKYDYLNRPIATGIKDTSVLLTQTQMQLAVDNYYAAIPTKPWRTFGESFVGNVAGNVHGYSNKSYPVAFTYYTTITYYDTYDFRNLWYGDYTYLNEGLYEVANSITYQQPVAANLRVIGQVTGTKVKVLDGGFTGGYTWLKSITYYDDKYRVVQTLTDNYKGGTDRVTNVIDFVGKVLESKSTHTEADVTWRDMVYVKQEGNKLTSVSGPGQFGFGCASVQQLAAGQDGWFEFTVTETNTSKFIGFNDSNSGGTSPHDLNYAFQLYYTTLYVQENATVKGTVTGLVPGDILRIERVGTTISFKRNGNPITTSTLTPSTTALFIDNSFHIAGNTISGVRSSFSTTISTTTRRFEYDHTGRLIKTWHEVDTPIQWKNLTGLAVDYSTSSLIKTSTVYGWNAGASTPVFIEAGTDGWAECKPAAVDPIFGLTSTDPDAGYTSINYAIYFEAGNQANIYESGVFKGRLATFTSADVFRIERINGVVYYKKNGVTFYTSATSSTGPLLLDTSFDYPGGRLTNIKLSSGNILLSLNEYNEIGQLVDKKLHSTVSTGTNAKQSVDYRYNIRGWLTSMNDASLANTTTSTKTNDDTGDLFGMNLAYNTTDLGLANTPLYNGNISGMAWSNNLGLGTTKQNGYTYTYDKLNRIQTSSFKEKNTAWSVPTIGKLSETGFNYDLNGNIINLRRNETATNTWMDDLTYTYTGNQLQRVTDTGDDFAGFLDGQPGTGNDYTYDANGNMITDLNKGISTAIAYNYLNLPEVVTKGGNNIRYIYDATGRKLAQVTTFGGQQKQVDYAGEFQYENDQLQFISHEEGRIAIANNKTIVIHSGDAVAGITAATSTLAPVTQNSGQNYIRATAVGTTAKQGMFPIGGTLTVQAGEQYRIRAKGYRTANNTNQVHLYIRTNSTDLNWPGAQLPKSDANATNESYVEQVITIPAGHTTLQAGVVWNTVAAGEQFFVNDFEITKLTTNATPEYQYNLKDHLGNVRLTFTTKNEVETNTATLETANMNLEQSQFLRYANAKRIQASLFDRTNGSAPTTTTGFSVRLNGSANEKYGLAKSLSVMPGDVINTEVYAKYVDPTSSNWNAMLTTLMSQIAASTVGVVVDGTAYGNSTSTFPTSYGGLVGKTDNGAPKAYLNWLVFDRSFIFITGGFKQITTTGKEAGTDVPHERIFNTSPITITQPGYVYIYLSNENLTPVEVYFDDFKVTHTKSPVIQTDDYYPFGLAFNSNQRENGLANKFVKFQGQEHVDELDLGWDSFRWRNHQPDIGRFFNVDPLAEKYYYNSPYAFSENNVIVHIELEGLEKVYIFDKPERPQDNGTVGTSYPGSVYVVHDDGRVNGPYAGSSYPDSKSNSDNSTSHRTINEGTHLYNNVNGHKAGTKKGLNIVDENGSRVAPGKEPDGTDVTMTVVNVHQGATDNGNFGSRGSEGCITVKPADATSFFDNFDWSGANGTKGNSSGTITIHRSNSEQRMLDEIHVSVLKLVSELEPEVIDN